MDILLNYKEKGEGTPLILLHGNGESLEYFVHQIDYFSKHYRVIAIDTRGHGKSPRGAGEFSLSRFAEDLNDFMTDKGIDKAHILGFSDGGNIALIFTLRYPDKVLSLILNGANLNSKGVKRRVQIPIEFGYFLSGIFAKFSKKALKNHEILSLMVKEPHICPKSLEKLKIPTLIIVGTHDMIKEAHSRLMARSIPRSQLEIIDGDHFIANKNSIEFNKTAKAFLSGQKP